MVYPPVDTQFFHPDGTAFDKYALIVSALVPYKRIELAIDACRLASIPLKVVGDGPERRRLERFADRNVEFLGHRSDVELRELYRRAAMVLMPGEEDFGIVPVEAQACGRPVVAYGQGGALESVLPGQTGLLVDDQTPAAFASAIHRALELPFDSAAIRRHAERFNRTRFGDEMEALIAETLTPARENLTPEGESLRSR